MHVAARVPGWADRLGRTLATLVWALPVTLAAGVAGVALSGRWDVAPAALGAVPDLELLEFSRSREMSLCCEGGGGRMFFEVEATYQRNAEVRVLDAVSRGAEIIATACPFCVMTLEDPATEKGLAVKELSEILTEVL